MTSSLNTSAATCDSFKAVSSLATVTLFFAMILVCMEISAFDVLNCCSRFDTEAEDWSPARSDAWEREKTEERIREHGKR